MIKYGSSAFDHDIGPLATPHQMFACEVEFSASRTQRSHVAHAGAVVANLKSAAVGEFPLTFIWNIHVSFAHTGNVRAVSFASVVVLFV